MKASEFDRKCDEGENIIVELAQEQRLVNVDFPSWMIEALDREARRLGVAPQSVIKFWISERLKREVS